MSTHRTVPLLAAALCVTIGACGTLTVGARPISTSSAIQPRQRPPTVSVAAVSEPARSTTAANGVTTTTTAATTTTSTTTTSTAPVVQPPAADGRLTLAFAGDALWHSPLWRQAERNFAAVHPGAAGMDFSPMLARLRPLIEVADVGVCHLETPIAPTGEQFSTHPLYGVPPEVVAAIAGAGFDRCSTASNHSADRGVAGIVRTVDVLAAHGIEQAGMARTPEEAAPRVFAADGVRIAHLSYTFGLNGLRLPAGDEWRAATIDPQRIITDAQAARRLGATVVVVSLHWGVEGQAGVTPAQRVLAEQVTASGAVDLIVGHHAHVLQPIEQINGVWVIYGLGNMISNLPTSPRWPAASQDGAVAVVDVTVGADGTVTVRQPVIHPTWVDRDHGWVVYPVQATLADPALDPWLRGQLETSLQRTRAVLGPFVPA